jgi:hypothetical protein
VHVVEVGADGECQRVEQLRRRAKCTSCRCSFTCYPKGIYPRRQYQIDVVAIPVAAMSLGGETAAAAAGQVGASATSARRWTAWVAALAAPAELLALAARLDPDAPVGAGLSMVPSGSGVRHRAGSVLAALEHLGAALLRRGVALVERSGLGRVLGWQYVTHGDVIGIASEPKTLSPAMDLGG